MGVFNEINGCISTGKEANVYHAKTEHGEDLAVKVYKTSILAFKDRARWELLSHSLLNCNHPSVQGPLHWYLCFHSTSDARYEQISCKILSNFQDWRQWSHAK